MAHIAYLLLCHEDVAGIIAQARRITAAGDFLAIHLDGRAKRADHAALAEAFRDDPRVILAPRRIKCGWGEWSLVEATLVTARAALDAFPRATHFYMLSGGCLPIKSAAYCREFLDRDDCDYIENHDFFASDWIRTGFKEERLVYRHYFNERRRKRLFYGTYAVQKRLGLKRRAPADLSIMIGSQWWCLRRGTLERVLAFCVERPDVPRFFRTTWIPDETFFQTLVHHLVPRAEIRNRTLTFLMFSDYGMPVTFYDDHYELLLAQDYLFARKISPGAALLKDRLGALYVSEKTDFDLSGEGRRLFGYLTGRGRIGRRFAPRFWEREASLGRERELLILTCKKWHVARRLRDAASAALGIPTTGYLFDEVAAGLPDLGGIEATLSKRDRHRRALVRMLYDYHGTDRLMICVDPSRLPVIRDFETDRARVRVLEIDCTFSDAYLEGHASRVGLAGGSTRPGAMARLLPTIRADFRYESDALDAAGLRWLGTVSERATPETNASALADFLAADRDTALRILSDPHLFDD